MKTILVAIALCVLWGCLLIRAAVEALRNKQ